jgi:HSP20 family protein
MSDTELLYREPGETTSPIGFMNRFWDDFFGRPAASSRTLRPAVDVSESESELTVVVELPGLTKDDVKITIEDGVLNVSGEKKFDEQKKDRTFHRIERFYGAFQRSMTLPRDVDANAADASFKDGVLTITLPKSESSKPKTLKIR